MLSGKGFMRKISGGVVAATNHLEATKIISATNPATTHKKHSNVQDPPEMFLVNPFA